MDAKLKKIIQAGRSNFFDFCNIVTRDDGLEPFADFQQLICNRIDNQIKTNSLGIREMFSVPPGYGKSTLLSQLLPAYLLGIDPSNKIMLISYGSELSKRNAKMAKAIMQKPIYKLMFPETQILGQNENPPFDTIQGGGMRSMGRGGAITGFRADYILIDDILKGPEEAASESIIHGIYEWYPTVANTRLKPGGGIIILATRWTKKDLIGYLSAQSNRWNYVNLEAICTDTEKDPLHRKVGEPLWPSYKPLEDINEIRRLNERAFQVVFQGNCTAAENTAIDKEHISYVSENPYKDGYTVLSYDTASKVSMNTDYSAICAWSLNRDLTKAVCLEIRREKVEFPELLKIYKDMDYLYRPHLTIIEDANSGVQLIQMNREDNILQSKVFRGLDDKFGMGELLDMAFRNKNVQFLAHLHLQSEILTEINEFPFGVNDDVVLSILHFMRWFLSSDKKDFLKRRSSNFNFTKAAKMAKKIGNKRTQNLDNSAPFKSAFR